MDSLDNIWSNIKRFFFSGLLIILGVIFLVKALTILQSTCIAQSKLFFYGAFASLLLGLLSIYIVTAKRISKILMAVLTLFLLGGVVLFTYFNFKSINDEIVRKDQTEKDIALAKQGLLDIQKIQDAYDKKYNNYATSFDSLVHFAKTDSISVLVEATGEIPTRRMTMEEAKQLGYRDPKEVISEEEAIKLNLIVRRYEKVPVGKYLFSNDKDNHDLREYEFDIDKISDQRTIDTTIKKFVLRSVEIDSASYGVEVVALPPYGPSNVIEGYNCEYTLIQDTLKLGSLTDRKMNTNWKK